MVKYILFIFFSLSYLSSAVIHYSTWKNGETFSEYIQRYGIGQDLIRSISDEDSKFLSEIQGGEKFYELLDKNNTLISALIPIGEEMQIQLTKELKTGKYKFDITPIEYKNIKDKVLVDIKKSCYEDIDDLTNNPRLGFLLKRLYGKSLNFRKFHKGDKIAFIYSQKSRLGKKFGQPHISASVVRMRSKNYFLFVDKEGNGWSTPYKIVKESHNRSKIVEYIVNKKIKVKKRGGKFIYPLSHIRITSRFTYKRWHPILHIYRPHLGVDFGAKRGTAIHAIGSGRVIYSGWMRGYGRVIKIDHGNGYVSLYAHQSRLRAKLGSYVKRGQVIGYIGTTGRSTGPHLHLGVYKNGRAINPLSVIGKNSSSYTIKTVSSRKKRVEKYTKVITKKIPIYGAKQKKEELLSLLASSKPRAYKWEDIAKEFIYIKDINAKN